MHSLGVIHSLGRLSMTAHHHGFQWPVLLKLVGGDYLSDYMKVFM